MHLKTSTVMVDWSFAAFIGWGRFPQSASHEGATRCEVEESHWAGHEEEEEKEFYKLRPANKTDHYGNTVIEEEEEEFYKLRPANKTDHLCQSWQYCHMFMKFRQSIT